MLLHSALQAVLNGRDLYATKRLSREVHNNKIEFQASPICDVEKVRGSESLVSYLESNMSKN